jgi:hypothetical protein
LRFFKLNYPWHKEFLVLILFTKINVLYGDLYAVLKSNIVEWVDNIFDKICMCVWILLIKFDLIKVRNFLLATK